MSFRLKTIIGVALIEAFFLVLLVWQATSYLQRTGEDALTQRAQQTAELFALTAKNAVIGSDLATLDEVTEEIAAMADVAYIRVVDTFGVMATAGAVPADGPVRADTRIAEVDDGLFDVVLPIEEGGVRFGEVQVGLNAAPLVQLLDTARLRLFAIAAAELLMVALLSWWFGSYLSRGLGELQRAAGAIARGEWRHRVKVTGDDELAATARAFNLMTDQISSEQAKLAASNRELLALNETSQSQALYLTTVLESMAEGIMTLDARGTITHINSAGEALFGYHHGGLLGVDVAECFTELPVGIADWLVMGELASREPIEALGVTLEGGRCQLTLSLAAITLSGERALVALVHDHTEQQRLEAEVRRTTEIKAMITDASLDAVVMINMSGRVIEYSAMAESIFGWTRNEIMGQLMHEFLVPEEMRDPHRLGMERFSQTGTGPLIGQRVEIEALRKSGERFPVELALVAAELDGERVATAFLRDISARKEAEGELIQARDAAELASQAKSRFLAHMSHEIRSPLNAVIGSVNLVSERIQAPEHRRLLQTAQSSGAALLSVINEVLDFSKIEAGHLVVEHHPVALEPLVEGVMNAAQTKLNHAEVELLALVRWQATGQVLTDPVRLRQILTILVDNAIKFTHQGVIAVDIQRFELDSDDHRLEICVSDTGVGIPVEHQASIFQEFEQVDPARDSRYGGTGLGLTIARRLVGLLGGDISVESAPGEGSCFRILLPVSYLEAPPPQPPSPAGPILVVSSHVALRTTLLARINSWGAHGQALDSLDALLGHRGMGALAPDARVLVDERCLWKEPEHIARLGDLEQSLAILVSDKARLPSVAHGLRYIDKPLCASQLRGFLAKVETDHRVIPHDLEPSLDHGCLLLVEDVEANRFVAAELLRGQGYVVHEALDGIDALEQAAARRFDVILMDVRMPRMNGIDAVVQLRDGNGPNATTPVIALTANAERGEMERCRDAGMEDFISKPFDKERLLRAIRQQLPATTSDAVAPATHAPGTTAAMQAGEEQMDDASCLERAVLEQMVRDTSQEALVPMLDMFLAELDVRERAVAAAISHRESLEVSRGELREQAHALKSCCGTFGASRLQSSAQALETAALNDNVTSLLRLAGVLLEEMEHARRAFEAYRAEAGQWQA